MSAPLDIRWTRPVGAKPSSVTVRKDPAGRSFVSALIEEVEAATLNNL
jgi:putative transposase